MRGIMALTIAIRTHTRSRTNAACGGGWQNAAIAVFAREARGGVAGRGEED